MSIRRSRPIVFGAAAVAVLGGACGASTARRGSAPTKHTSHQAAARGGTRCSRYAAPTGSDAGSGTARAPFRSIARLDASLSPGQTGCLMTGIYGGVTSTQPLDRSGTPRKRITITSAPGEVAQIDGYVEMTGAYTTLSRVRIDGSNTIYKQHPPGVNCAGNVSEPLDINAPGVILENSEYYQSVPSLRGNAIGIGFSGNADNTVIRFNKIHDVGSCMAYDHLIYLSHGNNVQIYDNWLWNDPHGQGIQVYPAPTNARIWGNVIDHAGVGFDIGDEAGEITSGNHIFNNIVLNSTGLPWENLAAQALNVWWGGTPGKDNTFTNNDSFNNPGGIGLHPWVTVRNNISIDPQFVNEAAHVYMVQNAQVRRALRIGGR
jgi:hypothetical protein